MLWPSGCQTEIVKVIVLYKDSVSADYTAHGVRETLIALTARRGVSIETFKVGG